MAHLSLGLLGPVQVALDGEPVTDFESEKVRALLAYLAAAPERAHRREFLAEMLWPGRPEGAARANLRHTLACLRQAIGDHGASPPFLLPARHTIQFNEASDAWVDTTAFSALLPPQPPAAPASGGVPLRQLEEAVRLYRGHFVADVSLADSILFEEWRLVRREHFHRLVLDALWRLAVCYERQGAYEPALAHARRELELDPWDEGAHRQVMRLLALTGRRAEALAHYQDCRRRLAADLDVTPSVETSRLYEQIQAGVLDGPARGTFLVSGPAPAPALPPFLQDNAPQVRRPVFVARERELARLQAHLAGALAGHGRVVLIAGGPGRGKTALLAEFARQAIETYPDLLATLGNCNAYSGSGDPYLPFREILAMLTGDVEARWLAGAISTGHARRLWDTLPLVVQALVQHGPQVTGSLVAERALLARATLNAGGAAARLSGVPWLRQLQQRVKHRPARSQAAEPGDLFQQVTQVLRCVAETHPLLLVVDDLQWADAASIGLLFHLGRRLAGARILIAGAYRPEEVALGRGQERHPLDKVLCEFKRTFGDAWLDLSDVKEAEQRRFVQALVESEPNRLGDNFCRVLAEHTGGHPLFTVELLRAMQARGDLVRDGAGRWVQGPVLDWDRLPARVEGVIEERIGRLEPELRRILAAASVEGEDFSAQVLAHVLHMEEGPLLHRLAHDLEARHRLVREQEEIPCGPAWLSRYKFGHALVQNYLYRHLGRGERRSLHARVAAALEQVHAGDLDALAVQLAHHYSMAGDEARAFPYLIRAAENAARVYAHAEAVAHYSHALEIAGHGAGEAVAVADAHRGRGQAHETLGELALARADYEAAVQTARGAGERQAEWRALLDLAKLWRARDYTRTRDYLEQVLDLARRLGDPAILADSLNWLGNWHLNMEEPRTSLAYHAQALQIFKELGDRQGLAATLNLLGIASLIGNDMSASLGYYDQAIALFREMGDRLHLAASLTGRGHAGGGTSAWQAVTMPAPPSHSRRDFEEAQRITQEIGAPADEAWTHWSLGLLHLAQGRYGQALKAGQSSYDIATRIGHREWIVASRCVLAYVYVELLAPERALQQLELALPLAQELCSRHWIHNATGTLAAAYGQRGQWTLARTCLETVLNAETPMDTLQKRYCWARRAEVALGQGDPALALEIAERLIPSAPGLPLGAVIPLLWKLKGEALAALGRREEALSLLRAAQETAQARGERFLLWRLHASLGRLYHALGHRSQADHEFSRARQLVGELAATLPDTADRNHFVHTASRDWPPG
ncbi:MAG: tetratricopeptide repeat protein [Anaerolineae bacterium]